MSVSKLSNVYTKTRTKRAKIECILVAPGPEGSPRNIKGPFVCFVMRREVQGFAAGYVPLVSEGPRRVLSRCSAAAGTAREVAPSADATSAAAVAAVATAIANVAAPPILLTLGPADRVGDAVLRAVEPEEQCCVVHPTPALERPAKRRGQVQQRAKLALAGDRPIGWPIHDW